MKGALLQVVGRLTSWLGPRISSHVASPPQCILAATCPTPVVAGGNPQTDKGEHTKQSAAHTQSMGRESFGLKLCKSGRSAVCLKSRCRKQSYQSARAENDVVSTPWMPCVIV